MRDTHALSDTAPRTQTAIRTWFGPMTNGTKLPAWNGDSSGLTLWHTRNGGYDLREAEYDGQTTPDYLQDYRIGFGLASFSGLLYWMAAVPMIAYAVVRRREPDHGF